jgi:hypothetical protein
MSGRGDNNKHGSAGRGASNQSNQPFAGDDEKQPKSNHTKSKAGQRSTPRRKTKSDDVERNTNK